MYDVSKLNNAADCRVVMKRAQERGRQDIYARVFHRYCELMGDVHDDPSDPLIRDFYATLAAYEQLLSEKNGRKTSAARTRQKIANKGIQRSLVEWTLGKIETAGFTLLLENGLPQYTGEYLVVKYARRFPADVVEIAKKRLKQHDVDEPEESVK